MKKLMSICMLLFAGLYSISSFADEPVWETAYFPAYEGYVVSYERPSGWQDDRQNTVSKKRYAYEDGKQQEISSSTFSSSLKDMKALNERIGFKPLGTYGGEAFFRISQYHLPRPIKLANWVEKEKLSWKDYAMIVYNDWFADDGGKKSFYYESSDLTILKNGKKVPAENPTNKHALILFNDEVLLEIAYGVRYFDEQYGALKPVFERMLNSIQVTSVEKLEEKGISEVYVTPEVVIADGGHGYSVGFSFTLPPGWSAEVTDVKDATPKEKCGRLAVKVFPKEGNEVASFLLIVEALQPTDNGFQESEDRLIKELIRNFDPGSGEKTKTPDRFICSGHAYNLIFAAGGKITHYKTFQGKDGDGRPVKARIYTGGNNQAACHFIYINDPADYENLIPTVEKIYDSINSIEDMVR